MTVELVNDKQLWDDFMENSPAGTLFHRWDYLKIIEKYSGYRFLPYGFRKGSQLFCLLPLFYKHKGGLKFLYSPPQMLHVYTPSLGYTLGASYRDLKQHKKETYLEILADDTDKIMAELSPNYALFTSGPSLSDVRYFQLAGYDVSVWYSYVLDLQRPLEEIWAGLHQTCRTSIRGAEKKALELRPAGDAAKFFGIMQKRLSKYGKTFFHSMDPGYLTEIMETFPDNVKMNFLYDAGDLVDAAVTVEYKDRVLLWMQGSNASAGDYGEYLQWEFIRQAHQRGFKAYENWGAQERRLNRFKAKFNPSLETFYSVRKDSQIGQIAKWAYNNILENPYLRAVMPKTL